MTKMNKKDKKILELTKELKEECNNFIEFVTTLNPCASTDRKLEKILNISKEIEHVYQN